MWSENILHMIIILLNLLRCILWPWMWSLLVTIPCELRRMCILLLFHGVFQKCQIGQVNWQCCSGQLFPLFSTCLIYQLLWWKLELNSYFVYPPPFTSVSFYLMYFDTLMLVYTCLGLLHLLGGYIILSLCGILLYPW